MRRSRLETLARLVCLTALLAWSGATGWHLAFHPHHAHGPHGEECHHTHGDSHDHPWTEDSLHAAETPPAGDEHGFCLACAVAHTPVSLDSGEVLVSLVLPQQALIAAPSAEPHAALPQPFQRRGPPA